MSTPLKSTITIPDTNKSAAPLLSNNNNVTPPTLPSTSTPAIGKDQKKPDQEKETPGPTQKEQQKSIVPPTSSATTIGGIAIGDIFAPRPPSSGLSEIPTKASVSALNQADTLSALMTPNYENRDKDGSLISNRPTLPSANTLPPPLNPALSSSNSQRQGLDLTPVNAESSTVKIPDYIESTVRGRMAGVQILNPPIKVDLTKDRTALAPKFVELADQDVDMDLFLTHTFDLLKKYGSRTIGQITVALKQRPGVVRHLIAETDEGANIFLIIGDTVSIRAAAKVKITPNTTYNPVPVSQEDLMQDVTIQSTTSSTDRKRKAASIDSTQDKTQKKKPLSAEEIAKMDRDLSAKLDKVRGAWVLLEEHQKDVMFKAETAKRLGYVDGDDITAFNKMYLLLLRQGAW